MSDIPTIQVSPGKPAGIKAGTESNADNRTVQVVLLLDDSSLIKMPPDDALYLAQAIIDCAIRAQNEVALMEICSEFGVDPDIASQVVAAWRARVNHMTVAPTAKLVRPKPQLLRPR